LSGDLVPGKRAALDRRPEGSPEIGYDPIRSQAVFFSIGAFPNVIENADLPAVV